MGAVSTNQKCWQATLAVEGVDVDFKLDTGAEVTAISSETYQICREPLLEPATKIVLGPARQKLPVIGRAQVKIDYKGVSTKQQVYVIEGLKVNLLGLPAIQELNIIKRVDALDSLGSVKSRFPSVFRGLGTLGDEYKIELREGAVPYSLFAPRTVAIPLRAKVKEELQRMESIGVISKASKPTEWYAGLVVVPKKTGQVRICVDLKALNESVLREAYPILKVDKMLAQLAGAQVFSKLDANIGFWQIPLAPESRPLTTFITPFGRYQFNKLPFDISSAPELFQQQMNRILEGLPGVLCLIDDVVVFGATQEEHDQHLEAALRRIEKARCTLNPPTETAAVHILSADACCTQGFQQYYQAAGCL